MAAALLVRAHLELAVFDEPAELAQRLEGAVAVVAAAADAVGAADAVVGAAVGAAEAEETDAGGRPARDAVLDVADDLQHFVVLLVLVDVGGHVAHRLVRLHQAGVVLVTL